MRIKRIITATVGVAAAFAVGTVISLQIAASAADDDTRETQPVVLGKHAEDLPPLETLGNGQTAGDWRLEDPPSKRPDFIPLVLPGGIKGYVRFLDMFGDPLPLATSESTRDDVDRREPGAGLEPDETGDVWAPVFDQTGENIIGKWLVASG